MCKVSPPTAEDAIQTLFPLALAKTAVKKTLLDWLLQFVIVRKKGTLKYGFEKLRQAEILLPYFHDLPPRGPPSGVGCLDGNN